MKINPLIIAGLVITATTAYAVHEPRVEDAGDPPTFEVVCEEGATAAEQCEVDKNTYVGWRTYAQVCQVCHGGSALGSTVGPNLMDRINKEGVDWGRFQYVLQKGYTGQMGAMPAFEPNPTVMKNASQLYSYLQARATELLPQGRPKKMKAN